MEQNANVVTIKVFLSHHLLEIQQDNNSKNIVGVYLECCGRYREHQTKFMTFFDIFLTSLMFDVL